MSVSQVDNDGYAAALAKITPKLNTPPHFLHAPLYGRWQELAGNEVRYFVIKNSSNIIGCGIAVRLTLPGGYYFYYCPYGPLVTRWSASLASELKEYFKTIKDKKLLFARVDSDNLPAGLLKTASASAATTSALQARNEWLLDISESEETLLKNMHHKCRYHIRMAERADAKFRTEKCTSEQLEIFYGLLKVTASRDNFHIFPKSYYQAAFKAVNDSNSGLVAYADIDGKIAAAAFCVSYAGVTHYIYGASANEFLKIGPGYFLHWNCILKARASGDKTYNFGGVSGGVKGAQLAGVTGFKQRFGGYNESHELPSDIVINPLGYKLFTSYKHLRR